jgi:hypothetical protein
MDTRKNWTAQQDLLRKALASKAHFDEAIILFLAQHAAVHSAEISGGQNWSLHDEVLAGLSEAQIKSIPGPGRNSIAWLLWHITRIEDMTINTLMMDQEQIWTVSRAALLRFPVPDCGTGWQDEDVSNFSAQINVRALLEYRADVGRQTRAAIPNLNADQAREIVPTEVVQTLVDAGSIGPKASGLFEFYTNRPRSFFLTRTATSHNFIHLVEIGRVRGRLLGK